MKIVSINFSRQLRSKTDQKGLKIIHDNYRHAKTCPKTRMDSLFQKGRVEMRVPRTSGFFTKDIGKIAEKHKNSIN